MVATKRSLRDFVLKKKEFQKKNLAKDLKVLYFSDIVNPEMN